MRKILEFLLLIPPTLGKILQLGLHRWRYAGTYGADFLSRYRCKGCAREREVAVRLVAALLLLLLIPLSGCAAFRALIPGGVSAADAEWSGVKAGPVVGLAPALAGQLGPQAGQLAAVLSLLGQTDPLGVLMPTNVAGDPVTRWVLCAGEFRARCEGAPVNASVAFAGKMEGIFWRPSRLSLGGAP